MPRASLICLSAVSVAACTTTVQTRPEAAQSPIAAVGVQYQLPALRYEVTTTYTLTDCEVNAGKVTPVFETKVEAKPEYVAGESFVIDYQKLASWTKTSNFRLETYPNGTLKAVNVAAVDKSPEIAAGAIKAAFTIARLAAGIPGVPSDAGSGKSARAELSCPPTLADLAPLLEEQKRLTESIQGDTAKLERYVNPKLLGTLTERDKQTISDLVSALNTASDQLKPIEVRIADLGKGLSFTSVRHVQPTAAASDALLQFPEPGTGDPALRTQQLKWLRKLFAVSGPATEAEIEETLKPHLEPVALTLRPLGRPTMSSKECVGAGLAAGCPAGVAPDWRTPFKRMAAPSAVPGLVTRAPAYMHLRICRSAEVQACKAGAVKALASADVLAPQMGRLVVLPFRNGFGADNKLEGVWRADGSAEWISYTEAAAQGVAAVNTLNTGLDGALAFAADRRAAQEADRKEAEAAATTAVAAPGAELDRQIGLRTKELELLQAQTALDPAALEASRELGALRSEIARLELEKTLRDLRAAVPGATS